VPCATTLCSEPVFIGRLGGWAKKGHMRGGGGGERRGQSCDRACLRQFTYFTGTRHRRLLGWYGQGFGFIPCIALCSLIAKYISPPY